MPSPPNECVQTSSDSNSVVPTCQIEFQNKSVPSLQYQCNETNAPTIQSVMVHATDPESGVRAPFKLEPGKGCDLICEYTLGNTSIQVKDIKLTNHSVQIGSSLFTTDTNMCTDSNNSY